MSHTHTHTHIQQTQTYTQQRREATKQRDTADMHTERTQIHLQHFTWNMCHDIAFSRIHLFGCLDITRYKVLTKCSQQHESNTQCSAKIRAVYGETSSTEWDHGTCLLHCELTSKMNQIPGLRALLLWPLKLKHWNILSGCACNCTYL